MGAVGAEECRSIILHPELAETVPKPKYGPEFHRTDVRINVEDPSTLSKDPWAADMERTLI